MRIINYKGCLKCASSIERAHSRWSGNSYSYSHIACTEISQAHSARVHVVIYHVIFTRKAGSRDALACMREIWSQIFAVLDSRGGGFETGLTYGGCARFPKQFHGQRSILEEFTTVTRHWNVSNVCPRSESCD